MDKKDTTQDELKQASSNETETKESEKVEDAKIEENENTVELETQETEVFVMGNKSEDEKLEEKTEVLIAQFPVAEKTEVEEEKTAQSQENELEKNQEEKTRETQEFIQEIKNESIETAQENLVENYETSAKKITEKPEKQKSKFRLFFEGLYYRLSYTPALGFVGVMAIICYLGWTFFLNTGKLHMGNTDVENACLIMIFFFAFMCILFCLLFVSSIILNIIRRIKGKR